MTAEMGPIQQQSTVDGSGMPSAMSQAGYCLSELVSEPIIVLTILTGRSDGAVTLHAKHYVVQSLVKYFFHVRVFLYR